MVGEGERHCRAYNHAVRFPTRSDVRDAGSVAPPTL